MPDQTCNTACRRAYATLLRAFLTGRCTNDEYDDGRCAIVTEHGYDDACEDIHAVVWAWYSDLREHRLDRAFRRTSKVRRFGARAIFFLRTEEPYESAFAPSSAALCKPLIVLPLTIALVIGLWLAPPLVLAGLVLAWLIVAIATMFGPGVEWRPGLFAHLDAPGIGERWPFGDAASLERARIRPFWLAGG